MKLARTGLAGTVAVVLLCVTGAPAQRQMENLGRGVVVINQGDGVVYVGWRLLATDPNDITFNVYRAANGGEPVKLNDEPIAERTSFVDATAYLSRSSNAYFVKPVLDGQEQAASMSCVLPLNPPVQPYISIPLQTPPGYTPNDASVGDLDGDGEYEIVLHQTGASRDNSQSGMTDPPILEAYDLDGTFLWRINLGWNIREGAHYTQFMVYDLDGDGRAEVACKTADGTTDGVGNVIGDPDADYRNSSGYILTGPEYLTIFDGLTGASLVTTDFYPDRVSVRQWGDTYGNRVDRFLAAIAYLDGEQASLIMARGYYGPQSGQSMARNELVAWNWRDGRLTRLWWFKADRGITNLNREYIGQGNHNLSIADVDGDGMDEIVYGACAIDQDGTGLYSTGLGHGDAMHLSDLDPDRPGLEVWSIHENPSHPYAGSFLDAATGEVIWGLKLDDPGRGLALDIDPRYRGFECWTNNSDGLYSCKGERISGAKPRSCNMGVWWDGDLLRELLDGTSIDKWDYINGTSVRLLSASGCSSNNGTKSNPCLCADILGDWREEVIWRTSNNQELRIYTTTIPTDYRLPTLMHDPVYRLGVAWQNVAYNQPAHTGFYLGDGMERSVRPETYGR
jgi:rhamnogalacturonan endolyase